MTALPLKKGILQPAISGVERLRADQDLLVVNLKFPSIRDNSYILAFLNRSSFLLSFSSLAPLNWRVSHSFALFMVKDPLIPAEEYPWASYLYLF